MATQNPESSAAPAAPTPHAPPAAVQAVEDAIAQAESMTSAEIVVVIAARSGRYDRAEDMFGLACGFVALAVAWWLLQDLHPGAGTWSANTEWTLTLGLLPVVLIVAAWSVLGAYLATRFPALARPFIPRAQMESEVRRRGAEAFHMFRVSRTGADTGLLIFVSLYEHAVWVCGGDAVAERIPESEWAAARDRIVQGCRAGDPWPALKSAVEHCGKTLAAAFPRAADDANELPNTVRFLGE